MDDPKNLMIKQLLLTATVLGTWSSAGAAAAGSKHWHRYHSDCVTEYRTVINTEQLTVKACYLAQDLTLDWVDKNYPLMKQNPRRVRFWRGAYAKQMANKYTILRELVDECRGRLLSQKTLRETQPQAEQVFSISNPNLSNDISESFMLLPMTKNEAEMEMSRALFHCQK